MIGIMFLLACIIAELFYIARVLTRIWDKFEEAEFLFKKKVE